MPDINYLIDYFYSNYVNSVATLHTLRKIVSELETLEDVVKEEILLCVSSHGMMAASAIHTLSSIRSEIGEEGWALQLIRDPRLSQIEDDLARYTALLRFNEANLPSPELDSPMFQFGEEIK